MEIVPGDLGENRALAIIRLRAAVAYYGTSAARVSQHSQPGIGASETASLVRAAALDPAQNAPPSQKTMRPAGFWTRFWAGGTGLSPEASRSVVRSMRSTIVGLAGGLGGGSVGLLAPSIGMFATHNSVVGSIFLASGLAMLGLGFGAPRFTLTGYARKPLTAGEIETLMSVENDPTELAFLRVVAEAVQTAPALLETQTEDEIKAALETLGEAIDKLPRVVSPQGGAQTLRDEARKALADAENEPDSLIAASLRRRAEAQTKTAAAAERSTLILRRADALRREIEAQIDALRMGLSTLDLSQSNTPENTQSAQNAAAHLTQLAQSIQSVAREAGSLADARDEVDSWTDRQITSEPVSAPTSGAVWPAHSAETAVPDIATVGRAIR